MALYWSIVEARGFSFAKLYISGPSVSNFDLRSSCSIMEVAESAAIGSTVRLLPRYRSYCIFLVRLSSWKLVFFTALWKSSCWSFLSLVTCSMAFDLSSRCLLSMSLLLRRAARSPKLDYKVPIYELDFDCLRLAIETAVLKIGSLFFYGDLLKDKSPSIDFLIIMDWVSEPTPVLIR